VTGMMECFYLGTHQPAWLASVDVPLFVSHRRLAGRRTLPRRVRIGFAKSIPAPWALDSGGFSELSLYGEWRITPAEYVAAVARYDAEIGHLDWAAPQDWMTESFILAKTGLTVAEHQARTVRNLLELADLWWRVSDADDPFMPVLQGQTRDDYHRHADAYYAAGIRLEDYPVVGLGSVCRRQGTREIEEIVVSFTPWLALHGFGVKTSGLARFGHLLDSADSMAWSARGRRVPGCGPTHRNEANCLRFALAWRDNVLAEAERSGIQLDLFGRSA
jgi:hypothetical protein